MKNTRQEIVTATAQPIINYHAGRTSLAIHNLGSANVYIGSDTEVTVANGFPIVPGQSMGFSRQSGDDPRTARWFIAAANQTIAIIEDYLKNGE